MTLKPEYYGVINVLDLGSPDDGWHEITGARSDPGYRYAPYVPVHKTPDFDRGDPFSVAVWFKKTNKDNDMHVLNGMNIIAKTTEVLEKLKANRKRHAGVVKEARVGYVEQAQKVLLRRLGELKEGSLVALTFSLKPPQDHTSVYDTAIQMLELHTGDEIELDNSQVRTLVMDEWDWSQAFWGSNKAFSKVATEYAAERGW